MRNAKRTTGGRVTVDGVDFEWHLHREPQWCTADGWRGMVLGVRQTGCQREALIEWPMPKSGSSSVPYRQRPKIDATLLAQGIRQALENGWEPSSSGQPVSIFVG